jgi:hypothetical protein
MLTKLQSLVLSGMGLTGPLEDAHQPGLVRFLSLRHLDLGHNPGITAELPSSWYVLQDLETINISHTGIVGTLPAAYAALQQLREFRAVNCTGITGQLPATWGLLNLEVLELTNSEINGVLPSEWADASALQRVGKANVLTALKGRTTTASEKGPMAAAAAAAIRAARVQLTADQPGQLGLLQLRVLDLSVSGPGKGGLTGTIPRSFAAMARLQVSARTVEDRAAAAVDHSELTGRLPAVTMVLLAIGLLPLQPTRPLQFPAFSAICRSLHVHHTCCAHCCVQVLMLAGHTFTSTFLDAPAAVAGARSVTQQLDRQPACLVRQHAAASSTEGARQPAGAVNQLCRGVLRVSVGKRRLAAAVPVCCWQCWRAGGCSCSSKTAKQGTSKEATCGFNH